MRRLVAGLALGLLIGLMLGMAIPSQAGSGFTFLNRRITKLEKNVNKLFDRAFDLETDVLTLEKKTSNLDSSGYYTGSSDRFRIPTLCSGDPAVWELGSGLGC